MNTISKCEQLIYEGPKFMNELMEQTNTGYGCISTIIRKLKHKNKEILVFRIFQNLIVYIDKPEHRMIAFYKIKQKHKNKFKKRVPWQSLKPLIKPIYDNYMHKNYFIIDGIGQLVR